MVAAYVFHTVIQALQHDVATNLHVIIIINTDF